MRISRRLFRSGFLIGLVFGMLMGSFLPVHAKEDTPLIRSGNLSVEYMMQFVSPDGKILDAPQGEVTLGEDIDKFTRMKQWGLTSVEDYLAWFTIEPRKGEFNWTYHRCNCQNIKNAGLKYTVYSWVGFPPQWFMETDDYVPFKCKEHNQETNILSIWAPSTLEAHRRFYEALYEEFGNALDGISVAVPSDYGEIGYPAGFSTWLIPQEHIHAGFWAADEYARRDFCQTFLQKYGGLRQVNEAWGTSFKSEESITYPTDSSKRRYWIDYIEWYRGSMTQFVDTLLEIIREIYPDIPMEVTLGYGTEDLTAGHDISAISKVCSKHNVALRSTHGTLGYFWAKRYSTAAHFYGNKFFTEVPGNATIRELMTRVFHDVSSGVEGYTEWPYNSMLALHRYRHLIIGDKAVVDIAYLTLCIQ
jgi:hypothetical protein